MQKEPRDAAPWLGSALLFELLGDDFSDIAIVGKSLSAGQLVLVPTTPIQSIGIVGAQNSRATFERAFHPTLSLRLYFSAEEIRCMTISRLTEH